MHLPPPNPRKYQSLGQGLIASDSRMKAGQGCFVAGEGCFISHVSIGLFFSFFETVTDGNA